MGIRYESAAHERQYESKTLDVERAHARAKEVLAQSEIALGQFGDLYGEMTLKKDAGRVAQLEASFEKTPSKIYADILEAVVCEHGELSDWFGPHSQVIKTSRFDDYVNGIDLVVETESDNQQFSHLALGVDVTFNSTDLSKKFLAIKKRVDNGTLGEIKYFHSDRQHFHGRKRKIPQVVIGIEIEEVNKLALSLMNRKNKELSTHAVQVTILEEAALQLDTFAAYAERTGRTELVPILEAESQKIRELLEQKKALGITGFKADRVFEEIKRSLSIFAAPTTTKEQVVL